MKKVIALAAVIILCAFSNIGGLIILSKFENDSVKKLKVELPTDVWVVYLRNVDRLNYMAGRNVENSSLLLATKDTVAYFSGVIIGQLNDTTFNKK